jgi:hypothetical protein
MEFSIFKVVEAWHVVESTKGMFTDKRYLDAINSQRKFQENSIPEFESPDTVKPQPATVKAPSGIVVARLKSMVSRNISILWGFLGIYLHQNRY